jgi:hypothetical protein
VDVAPSCSDADGDTLSYAIGSQGSKGTASVVAGQLRYLANAGTSGTDTFTYTANDGRGGVSVPATVTITITAPGSLPTISVASAAVCEGTNPYLSTMRFTVTLSAPAPAGGVTVRYATSDVTASAGGDYIAASGILSFAAGEFTKEVEVFVAADGDYEGDETFFLTLSAPTGAGLGADRATGLIIDDDDAPPHVATVSISKTVCTTEPTEGLTSRVELTVSLDKPAPAGGVSVDYATRDGSAKAGTDYTAASGTVVFTPGELTKVIVVYVAADADDEDDEDFYVDLTGVSGAAVLSKYRSARIDISLICAC